MKWTFTLKPQNTLNRSDKCAPPLVLLMILWEVFSVFHHSVWCFSGSVICSLYYDGNISGYNTNTQKSPPFLYTNNKKSERKIKKTIPFTSAIIRIKYLLIKLSRETKVPYAETFKKEIKQMERYTIFLDWKKSILWKWLYYLKQSTDSVQSLSSKLSTMFFMELE